MIHCLKVRQYIHHQSYDFILNYPTKFFQIFLIIACTGLLIEALPTARRNQLEDRTVVGGSVLSPLLRNKRADNLKELAERAALTPAKVVAESVIWTPVIHAYEGIAQSFKNIGDLFG